MRLANLMWLALVIAVGASLFMLKYKVQALENELAAKNERIAQDRGAIRVLEAEWTYLNDPERLHRLSQEHLGMTRPAPDRVIEITDLPFRTAPLGADSAVLPQPYAQPAEAAQATLPRRGENVFRVSLSRLQQFLRPLLPAPAAAESPSAKGRAP